MAVYTTAKCGHCGENWTKLNPNAPNTVFGKIGPPVIRCVSCLKDNKTGYKLIRDFNLLEKLDLEEYFITSKAKKIKEINEKLRVVVKKVSGTKCPRCWKILETQCSRCEEAMSK